jgi:hypothetical protein
MERLIVSRILTRLAAGAGDHETRFRSPLRFLPLHDGSLEWYLTRNP